MADQLQRVNITISGIEDTGTQIKIRDQNKRTYSFFKNKKDGGETVAFADYKNYKIGDTVEASIREVPYKDTVIRNIVAIRPASGPAEILEKQQRPFGNCPSFTDKPGREYWEARELTRQNSILLQVAFKAAIELESARIGRGQEENKDKVYRDTIEFYNLMADEIENEAEQQDAIEGAEALG